MFAAIYILTVIVLITVMVSFGSANNVVYADSMKGIGAGIYLDEACTNRTLSLNWGVIEAGSSSNLTVYVRNEYNSAVLLRLGVSNWTPSTASSYMSLKRNYIDQVLNTNEVIPIELRLTVQPIIINITDFTFETIITTVGANH